MLLNAINTLNFNGIRPAYINNQNYKVIPISTDPTQDEINEAIKVVDKDPFASGCSGRAYFLGEDLVVKKYKTPQENPYYNPEREISALDKMYDKGIIDNSIQKGEYAFVDPNGIVYLVTDRLTGGKPNYETNYFNYKNLSMLLDIIQKLDTPILNKQMTQTNVPFEIPIHYDICKENINIAPKYAALLDFEYLNFEDLEYNYTDVETQSYRETNCNMSDVPGVISNLRSFEYRTLIDYIKEAPEQNVIDIFLDYLMVKSEYQKGLSEKYKKLAIEQDCKNEACETISKSYRNNGLALRQATISPSEHGDIIKAEAMKIQIASFIYQQSSFQRNPNEKINPIQIQKYIHEAKDFFISQYQEAINKDDVIKKNYYLDCIKVLRSWMGVINWMNWQAQTPDIDMYKNNRDYYNELKSNHDLFMEKLTPDTIQTLDETVMHSYDLALDLI